MLDHWMALPTVDQTAHYLVDWMADLMAAARETMLVDLSVVPSVAQMAGRLVVQTVFLTVDYSVVQ